MMKPIVITIVTYLFIAQTQIVWSQGLIELGKTGEANQIKELYPNVTKRLNKSLSVDVSAVSEFKASPPNMPYLRKVVSDYIANPKYPIKTKLTLSPNSTVQKINVPLSRPLCLVGADEISSQWLTGNRVKLKQMNALCIVIQAESVTDVEYLRRIADGVNLIALPMDAPLSEAGINQYPVLVMANQLVDGLN